MIQVLKGFHGKDLLINIVVLVLYLGIAKLSLAFSITEAGVTIFWPAGGFALAVLLLAGPKYIPGVFGGAVVAVLVIGGSLSFAVMSALGNTLETVCAYWLLTYYRPIKRSLDSRQDYFKLLFYGAGISTLISASIGPVSLVTSNLIELRQLPSIALRWWMGDAIGIAFMTPLLLVWVSSHFQNIKKTLSLELVMLFTLTFLVGLAVFFHWGETIIGHLDVSWMFPFIIWAATRVRRRYVALLQLMIFLQALLSASHGVGHYANALQETGLMNFWLFGMLIAVGGMALAIISTEKDKVVHELKERGKELREKEERLSLATVSNGVGVWDLYPQTKELIWDESMFALFHIQKKDFSGAYDAWVSSLHPDDRKQTEREIQTALSGGKDFNTDFRVIWPNGEIRIIKGIAKVFRDKGGKAIRMLGINSDITNLKLSEEKLKENESRLQDAIWGTGAGTYEWHVQTGELIVNELWAEMIGYSLQELEPITLDTWDKLIHPDDGKHAEELINRCISQEADNYECEVRLRHKNGHWVWVLDRGRVSEWSDDGKAVRMSGTHQDISNRKEAELILLHSEERYGKIFEGSLTEIFIFDAETYHFIKANNGARENLGYSDDELLKLTPVDIKPEISLEEFNLLVEPLLSGEKDILQFETLHQRKDGTRYNADIRLQLTDFMGQPAFVAIIIDITERKKSEENLRLLSRVFRDTQEGIIITDTDQLIIDANPAFSNITGYSLEDVIGKNPRVLSSGKHDPQFYKEMRQSITEHGHWQGEVWNRTKQGELYAELLTISSLINDHGEVTHYVGVFTDITNSKQQQEKLSLIAHYDVLTNLPNRALFVDRFHQAIAHSRRTEHQLAVCFLDLDDFKPVNDNYGHEAGDKLLIEVARRITACIREEDTVSRQGGDEFAILLNDIESSSQCESTMVRLHQSLAEPYIIDDVQHAVTASSGITFYPSDSGDIDTLLRHADQAMYQAKLEGKHRYQLFNPDSDQRTIEKHHHLEEIEQALVNNEFQLYYQPKVNMVTGDVFGAEALIRWIHPEKGLIPPLDFLPLIGDTPLDISVGEWVIGEALQQLDSWQRQGIKLEVSVNISSNHLLSSSFVENLEAHLAKYPSIDPRSLQIEILESSALGDIHAINHIIKTCQNQLGVSFSLDDFGTGYSSLTHLRSLPVTTIKIDQSFIRDMLDDPDDYTIIEGVIGLAKSFNRKVIAEGVETTAHGEMLLLMGCEQAQGYAIAKPIPATAFSQWLNNYSPNKDWLLCGNKHRSQKENSLKIFRMISQQWRDVFIDNIMSSPNEVTHWPILDTKHCPCGKWIGREEQGQLFEVEGLQRLGRAHDEVHMIAHAIQSKYQEGDVEATRAVLADLQLAISEMSNAAGLCE